MTAWTDRKIDRRTLPNPKSLCNFKDLEDIDESGHVIGSNILESPSKQNVYRGQLIKIGQISNLWLDVAFNLIKAIR